MDVYLVMHKEQGARKEIEEPLVIVEYNDALGGFDLSDMMADNTAGKHGGENDQIHFRLDFIYCLLTNPEKRFLRRQEVAQNNALF
ncbi:hypothetical protein NPIL_311071 [Nephila pilipes]|uniref:Uncharacterized protein n=1 Tax=Nephila pilipes TaxID=299642 RepID=A0A8X6I8V6_NEPPI|nr:hypothetical protein NPIL_407181 [Nephila pilipes]GFS47093.1 hypothetical protein NPIL_321971 [Nephila pilipes]GFS92004.1 hypothetical protein NPIL_323271 [Nephila pilipes]GFU03072.1 hypothetical protein NPIL_311071 [Nephila pilipes]